MSTLFSLLKEQHKEAKVLFKEVLASDPVDREKAKKVCKKLSLHMELEEKYLYPVMEEHGDTQETAKEAELEHAEAKKAIKDILADKLDDTELKVKVELLFLEIEHHVKEEESDFFPKIKADLPKEQVEEIKAKMLALMEKKVHLV
jgi:iron-sulfur cluster repair protein YtfE (RIC family)